MTSKPYYMKLHVEIMHGDQHVILKEERRLRLAGITEAVNIIENFSHVAETWETASMTEPRPTLIPPDLPS